MNMIFLGTGAAEGSPSYYCRCTLCTRIRAAGGKDIRSRSSFRIDGQHQIDFSPDIFYQMVKLGLDTYDLEHLLITHTHKDHFDIAEIMSKMSRIEHNGKPLNIYLSVPAAEWAINLIEAYGLKWEGTQRSKAFVLHPLHYYEGYDVGRLHVVTVPSSHRASGKNELAINYLITFPNGKKLLYASDTGWYSDETWQFLQGLSVDILIMECTFGNREGYPLYAESHLDIPNYLLMLERMKEIGLIREHTFIWATHINTAHHLLHEEMQQVFDQSGYRVTVAYDGLSIQDALEAGKLPID